MVFTALPWRLKQPQSSTFLWCFYILNSNFMFYTYLQLFFIFHFFFIDRYIGVSSSSFFFFSFVFIFKFIKKRTWTELTYLLGLNRDCFTNLSNISSQVGGSPVMLAIVGKIWEKLSYNWMDFFFEELNSTLNFSMMVLEIKCSFLTPLPNPTPPPVWFWLVFLLLPIFFFFKIFSMQDCWSNFISWLFGVAHAEICYGGRLGAKKAWYLSCTFICLLAKQFF